MATKTIQEVRICKDAANDLFGAIAVKDPLVPNNWGVMNPGIGIDGEANANYNRRGGHWAQDVGVEGWTKIQDQQTIEIPEPEPEPEPEPPTE